MGGGGVIYCIWRCENLGSGSPSSQYRDLNNTPQLIPACHRLLIQDTHTQESLTVPWIERGEHNRAKDVEECESFEYSTHLFLCTLLAKNMSQRIDCESLFKDFKMNIRF
jgi:hypothetical protein